MGDYVGKRGAKKVEPLLFNSDELTSKTRHKPITDFSLYAEESLTSELSPILQHFPQK